MSPSNSHRLRSAMQRYGFAVISVTAALLPALVLRRYTFHKVELPLFLFAVALTSWHKGVGPAVLSIVLSSLSFVYFFTPPLYSLAFTPADAPSVVILVCFGAMITSFSAVRQRVEGQLRQARDELQKEIAERTQQASLLNLTSDMIFVRDMSGVITYWNRGAQEMYGWAPDQAMGKRSAELLQTVFPMPIDDIIEQLLRTGRWEGELKHTRADGTQVSVASRWSLERDELGYPMAILETNNDITQRKRQDEHIQGLNRELTRRSTDLEAKNKELEAFAYSISHDLRAPLRHMAGYAELLQKKAASCLDEKSQHYVTMIVESVKRMGDLIDDLLAFSRIGRVETRLTLVNLDQLVKEALTEVRPEENGRDIAWKIDSLPVCYGDRSMLRVVFVNLLSNALKFTRTRQRAEIAVGCTDRNKDRDEVEVFVRDNGAGFDMKYADKLFGVFQRLHRSDAFEGTGIGLATVQRIIHRHGGRVRAEGAIDQGATFYFTVPRR